MLKGALEDNWVLRSEPLRLRMVVGLIACQRFTRLRVEGLGFTDIVSRVQCLEFTPNLP